LRHLDLFSGIGGFALAARWAGMETVGFCEIEPYCQKILRKHWPSVPIWEDVRKVYRFADDCVPCGDCKEPFCELCNEHFADCQCLGCSQFDDEIGPVDLVTAGFPCQDISVGHTWTKARGIDGERSGLWREVVRITSVVRPRWLLCENVPALRSRGLGRCLKDLWEIGYDSEWHIVSASSVGAEHKRERIWITAYPKGLGLEGIWPEGFQVSHVHEGQILSLCSSDGQWEVEPDFRRTDARLSGRMDRLKALGNSIQPQVAYQFLRAIQIVET
jgi:DNA (cytosine-5)-methyltransferase 1